MKHIFAALFLVAVLLFGGCESSPASLPENGGSVMLQYYISAPARVKVWIENNYGTTMTVVQDSFHQEGVYEEEISLSEYPEGVYFYILKATPAGANQSTTISKHFLIAL